MAQGIQRALTGKLRVIEGGSILEFLILSSPTNPKTEVRKDVHAMAELEGTLKRGVVG
jgi:hypothetical protein